MNNFLYCFDSNYNIQGYCSIFSLLENAEEKVNIYIIHKEPDSFKLFQDNLKKHINLNSLSLYKFADYEYDFPNLTNRHLTEATYYRLFISNYLPEDIDLIMYVDADAFFINKFMKKLDRTKSQFKQSDFTIGALTTNNNVNIKEKDYEKLNLTSRKYFNAGVLLINYQKWLKNDYYENLLKILNDRKISFNAWDQDILNSFLDGDYFELDEIFNININFIEDEVDLDSSNIENNGIIIHYIGSPKPWNTKGLAYPGQKYFYMIFRQLFSAFYFLQINNRKNSIATLYKIFVNKKYSFMEKKFKLFIEFFIGFLLKTNKNNLLKTRKIRKF